MAPFTTSNINPFSRNAERLNNLDHIQPFNRTHTLANKPQNTFLNKISINTDKSILFYRNNNFSMQPRHRIHCALKTCRNFFRAMNNTHIRAKYVWGEGCSLLLNRAYTNNISKDYKLPALVHCKKFRRIFYTIYTHTYVHLYILCIYIHIRQRNGSTNMNRPLLYCIKSYECNMVHGFVRQVIRRS